MTEIADIREDIGYIKRAIEGLDRSFKAHMDSHNVTGTRTCWTDWSTRKLLSVGVPIALSLGLGINGIGIGLIKVFAGP